MILTLNKRDIIVGFNKAIDRHIDSRYKNRKPFLYSGNKPLKTKIEEDVMGSIGEIAVAKAFGSDDFAPIVNDQYKDFKGVADFRNNIEIRTTKFSTTKRMSLIFRENEIVGAPDNYLDRNFILVLLHYTNFNDLSTMESMDATVDGWVYGRIGFNHADVWNPNNATPAHFFDRNLLSPIENLIKLYSNK
jgi:hypothetical protein